MRIELNDEQISLVICEKSDDVKAFLNNEEYDQRMKCVKGAQGHLNPI